MFFLKVSLLHISCNVAGCPNSHLPKGRSVDAHPYALFLELQDTMYDFLNFYPHHLILRISFICFTWNLKVLSMWDILLLDIWSTIFTKNPIGAEQEKFLKMHQNKAIGMPSRPEVISTPIPKQHSQQTVAVHSGLEKVK